MSQKLGFFHLIVFLFCASLSTFAQLTADFEIIYISKCPPGVLNFVNTSEGYTTCRWEFGNGNSSESVIDTLNQVYPKAGTFNVTLIVSDGVTEESVTKSIRIHEKPKAAFTTSIVEGCIPLQVTFTQNAILGDAEIAEYYWDFRNGTVIQDENPTITYNQVGEYDVLLRVTDANGCIDFIEKERHIKTHSQPKIDFRWEIKEACVLPTAVSFTNESVTALPLNYSWDFNNGQTSEENNPETEYTETGSPVVVLSATNDQGCAGSHTETLVIRDEVESDFRMFTRSGQHVEDGSTICQDLHILNNTSVPRVPAYWMINGYVSFQQGMSISVQNFESGWNTVELVPNDEEGCASRVTKHFYINELEADFEISEVDCDFPITVNYTNNSKGAVNYSWRLPQGNTSTRKNPEITVEDIYASGDYEGFWPRLYYTSTLVIQDINGCIDSASKEIVFKHPEAKITADEIQGCVPLAINFTDTTLGRGDLLNRTWLFDDEAESAGKSTSYSKVFTEGGETDVRLVVENKKYCKDTSEVITVYAGEKLLPDFNMSVNKICHDDSITFNSLTDKAEVIDHWIYSSTANIFSECEENPNPTLALSPRRTGYHDVSLEVDYNGCFSKTTHRNALYVSGPIASFSSFFECEMPTEINFESDLDQVSSFSWDFDDGSNNNSNANPVHNYTFPGDYLVSLYATNDTTSCSYEYEELVNIRQISADFHSDTIFCVGDSVKLDASASSDYINESYKEAFKWDYGIGAPFRTYNTYASKVYDMRGDYSIQLVVSDINGCTDTVSKVVHIFQPDPVFITDTASGCTPELTVGFTNTSTDTTITHFSWDMNDGEEFDDSLSFTHKYFTLDENYFYPKLLATDLYGCKNSYARRVDLYKPDATFLADTRKACLGDIIEFNTFYSNPDSTLWYFYEGAPVKRTNKFKYDTTGTFPVTQIMYKDYCVDTFSLANYINIEKAVAGFASSDTIALCYPQTILFTHINTGDEVVSGEWDFDFKGHQSGTYRDSAYFSYSLPGEFYPTLNVETKNGCKASADLKITVKGPYAEYEISDQFPCKLDSINFRMVNEKDVYEQLWDFGDGLASIEPTPGHAYTFVDTFITSLTISDINGCTPPAVFDTVFIDWVIARFGFENNDSVLCLNEAAQPVNQTEGAIYYLWKVDEEEIGNTRDLTDLNFEVPGIYDLSLEIENDNQCLDTTTHQLIVHKLPDILVSGTDTICRSLETAELRVETEPLATIDWKPSNYVESSHAMNTLAHPELNTWFIVQVTDTNGCRNYDSTFVFVHQFPELTRFPAADTTVLLGESAPMRISSSRTSTFIWNMRDTIVYGFSDSVNVIPEDNMVYTVNVEDICFTNTEEFVVNVREIYTVVLPDVFTPNGDGVNDRIYVRGGGIRELVDFRVFNRYGNLVYQSADITEGWDGMYKGKRQNPDVYTYFVRVITYNDEEVTSEGSFNLVY